MTGRGSGRNLTLAWLRLMVFTKGETMSATGQRSCWSGAIGSSPPATVERHAVGLRAADVRGSRLEADFAGKRPGVRSVATRPVDH